MMRVLMFAWEYPPHVVGGLGQHVTELVDHLGNLHDVELHLITPRWAGGKPLEHTSRAAIHRVEPPIVDGDYYTCTWQTNLRLEEYAQHLWQEHGPFDLVHVHDWQVAFVGVALKHNYRVPLVSTIHATEQGRWRGNLPGDQSRSIHHAEWWLAYESWRIVACSRFMAGEIAHYFHCPGDKIDVIPNGVDPTRFDQLEGQDFSHVRPMYALPEEQIVFHVGRVVYEKGAQTLVRAMPYVLASLPTAKAVVAGRGPQLDWLRSMAWDLGVGEKVLFTGYISDDDRDYLLKIADCAVFPSLYEPFGIVALEAMAARCPVVVSDVGGLGNVVEHGETGLTVFAENPASLAWGIVLTLQDPEGAAERAKAAYRVVWEQYNWQRIARLTADLYRRVGVERAATDW